MEIRRIKPADYQAVLDIYNDAILKTVATFDLDFQSLEDKKQWFEQHQNEYPLLVLEVENKVIAWASISPWSARKAYDKTVEVSVYVKEGCRGHGYGKKLLATILELAKELEYHTIIAQITSQNASSINLFKQFGFSTVGTLQQVGFKFNEFLDVTLMQKLC